MFDTNPPAVPISDLRVTAKIDFVTVSYGGLKIPLPDLSGTHHWIPSKGYGLRTWELTIHDPTSHDIQALKEVDADPLIMKLEVAVDLLPLPIFKGEARQQLLDKTFQAVAARFRPEDKALWAYGMRGAVAGASQPIMPLERKRAVTGHQLIYGHRSAGMQAKLYLKTRDQNLDLPNDEHLVRMELNMRRLACMDDQFGLRNLSDLLGYRYRHQFTKHFRIIAHPEVRQLRGLQEVDNVKRERAMLRAWKRAGVAKFAISTDLPADTSLSAIKALKVRQKAQQPFAHYKLMRDKDANAKIGSALMNLERRMKRGL